MIEKSLLSYSMLFDLIMLPCPQIYDGPYDNLESMSCPLITNLLCIQTLKYFL